MTISLPDTTLTNRQERTYEMRFSTPKNSEYTVTVHREILGTKGDGTTVRESTAKAYCEPVAKVATRAASTTFFNACKAAPSVLHLVGAISQWCDNLAEEVKAEQAAQSQVAPAPEPE